MRVIGSHAISTRPLASLVGVFVALVSYLHSPL